MARRRIWWRIEVSLSPRTAALWRSDTLIDDDLPWWQQQLPLVMLGGTRPEGEGLVSRGFIGGMFRMSESVTGEGSPSVEPTILTISAESLVGAGLESQVRSWVGEGPNEPITADQIVALVGEDRLAEAADALGRTSGDLAADLAAELPELIAAASNDANTPNGPSQTPGLQAKLLAFTVIAPASDLSLLDELPIDGHATLQLQYW
ncbi:YidB family protein [Embleya sp. NPDC059237]|uniref:YidB family protein n=1 Tax=Embleya sp. NPDC059237 TaxID=3346784 RepID=UPI0036B5FA24